MGKPTKRQSRLWQNILASNQGKSNLLADIPPKTKFLKSQTNAICSHHSQLKVYLFTSTALLEELTKLLWQHWQEGNLDQDKIKQLKRERARGKGIKNLPTNSDILKTYSKLVQQKVLPHSDEFQLLLRKRAIRSLSWIVPIQVLTKPFWCPGECIFCPNDPTMPKSYISSEPGAMRALLNQFDPVRQVYNRLISLYLTWHPTDKIEMIVLGGTWDVYPRKYKYEFVKWLYDAANTFDQFWQKASQQNLSPKQLRSLSTKIQIQWAPDLATAQKINEDAAHRIIWLTIETRPEYVTEQNLQFWRELGVTRVEMGVQSLFDDVLQANKRWHTLEQIRQAMRLLRLWWFKISIHLMAWLYGSDLEKDKKTFELTFTDPDFKPDEIKFYPTAVIPNTELYRLWLEGKYKPITPEQIKELIFRAKQNVVPPWTRIKRLIRDIPADEIVAWANITNLRQLALQQLQQKAAEDVEFRRRQYKRLCMDGCFELKNLEQVVQAKPKPDQTLTFVSSNFDFLSPRDFVCMCTRCREIRNRPQRQPFLVIRKYLSSVGEDYFVSFEDELGYLYGFLRLLVPSEGIDKPWLGKSTALIRELHVYGQLQPIAQKGSFEAISSQHKWLGKRLMETAQKIAKIHGSEKISVIAGVGVRNYYRQLGYQLEGTYMTLDLNSNS